MSYVAQRNVVCVQVDGIGLLMDVFVPTATDAPGKGYGLVCVASGGWTAQRNVTDAHEKAGYFRELCQRGLRCLRRGRGRRQRSRLTRWWRMCT